MRLRRAQDHVPDPSGALAEGQEEVAASDRFSPPGLIALGLVVAAAVLVGFLFGNAPTDPETHPLYDSTVTLAADAQAVWAEIYRAGEQSYRPARVVPFLDETSSGCGTAEAETGSFYCAVDEAAYVSLAQLDGFRDLDPDTGPAFDPATADVYLVAHLIGHHVQKLEGITRSVRELQQQNPVVADDLERRAELQAVCLAGVWWAQRPAGATDDVEAALDVVRHLAAHSTFVVVVPDGRLTPETFAHGTPEDRTRWFSSGWLAAETSECSNVFVAGL